MGTATELVHKMFFFHGNQGTPTGPLTTPYVATKLYRHLTFLVTVKNGASPTAATVTLTQAKTSAGQGAKALSFKKAYRVVSWTTPTTAKWEEFSVSNDAFSTITTASTTATYIVEVEDEMLDRDNDYVFVRLEMASGAGSTANIEILASMARNAGHIRVLANPGV